MAEGLTTFKGGDDYLGINAGTTNPESKGGVSGGDTVQFYKGADGDGVSGSYGTTRPEGSVSGGDAVQFAGGDVA